MSSMKSNSAYLASPGVSSHMLIEVLKSPAACYQRYLDPSRPSQSPSDAMRLGTAVHCLALTPRRFDSEVIVTDYERRSHAGKARYAALCASGQTVIKPAELMRAREIVAALHRSSTIRHVLRRGRPERTFIRPRSGGLLPLRGRVDLHDARRRVVVELKTCRSLDFVQSSIERYGYGLSAAFYRDWMYAVEVVMVFVESSEPYRTRAFPVSRDTLDAGSEAWRTALDTFDACWRAGGWPEAEPPAALDDDPLFMPMPAMAENAHRQRFDLPVGELAL